MRSRVATRKPRQSWRRRSRRSSRRSRRDRRGQTSQLSRQQNKQAKRAASPVLIPPSRPLVQVRLTQRSDAFRLFIAEEEPSLAERRPAQRERQRLAELG